jgi:ABC-type dipeptide/oligopeptide/nickel transport system ATPase subunit
VQGARLEMQGDVVSLRDLQLTLASPVAGSFRATKAANSLDIDQQKKSVHHFAVSGVDLDTPYNVGVIVGASGSGKTTLARHVWGAEAFRTVLRPELPVIDQFPEHFEYDQCAEMLAGVGLTAVPCWIRPALTLSNGQMARAECALQLARIATDDGVVLIDEWTSVVDRTVAKVMSHCVQKHARARNKRIVLLSCHYDVLDWLNPDWIIDCNAQKYVDRRLLCRDFLRGEQLQFDIRDVGPDTWRYFSKYHYLSDKLPGGLIRTYGVFHGQNQIGFQCFANYVPKRYISDPFTMHSNRTVIHPDYAGLGLGIRVITATSLDMAAQGFRVMAKYSSTPVFRSMARDPAWVLKKVERLTGVAHTGTMARKTGFRTDIKTYTFDFKPDAARLQAARAARAAASSAGSIA